SSKTLNGELLRHFAKLQIDEQPGIRVNTVICLGKIFHLLDESTRQKIVPMALLRSLQDPFPPTRLAVIQTFSGAVKDISKDELARTILPSLTPFLIDRESQEIRTQ